MNTPNKPLSGKTALVTGASRGIGAAIARKLAADGADVAMSYVASADKAETLARELADSHGVRVTAFQADQADADQVAALVKKTAAQFGKLDILVNNAGVFITGAIDDPSCDVAELTRQQAVNIGGVVAAVRAAVPFLPAGGRIITIGSIISRETPDAGSGRLQRNEGRRRRVHAGLGARPRGQAHHRQHRAAGPDPDGHGQRTRPRHGRLREEESLPRALRQAGGGRRSGGVPGEPGSVVHHRHDASTWTAGSRCERRVLCGLSQIRWSAVRLPADRGTSGPPERTNGDSGGGERRALPPGGP